MKGSSRTIWVQQTLLEQKDQELQEECLQEKKETGITDLAESFLMFLLQSS
jgi:hypothetical protein